MVIWDLARKNDLEETAALIEVIKTKLEKSVLDSEDELSEKKKNNEIFEIIMSLNKKTVTEDNVGLEHCKDK